MNDTVELKIMRMKLWVAGSQFVATLIFIILLLFMVTKITIINKADELRECQEALSFQQGYIDSLKGGGE